MRNKTWVSLLLVVVLLVACGNTGGPSDKEAKEIIYGVYLRDAKIVEKNKCELTSWMEKDGQTNVWLVTYQFEDSNKVNGMLLTEADGEWQTHLSGMDSCPE